MIWQGRQIDEADDAFEASVVGKADEAFVANEANVIDVIVTADKAIATNTAEASFAEADEDCRSNSECDNLVRR